MPELRAGAKSSWILLLACVCALGLGLRLASIGRLLPHDPEPDAYLVLEMQSRQADPALVEYVMFHERYPFLLSAGMAALTPRAELAPADASEAEHLAAAARPYVRMRLAVALLASLLVPLTWFLARRFLDPPTALLAAFFIATSLLHLFFSTEARPHGAHATFALVSVLASMHLRERLTAVRCALAIGASALAVSCLQLGLFTLPPLALALLSARGGQRWMRVLLAIIAPLGAALLGMLAWPSYPYIDAQGFHLAAAEGGGHVYLFEMLDFRGLRVGATLLWQHDPLLVVLLAAGLLHLVLAGPALLRRARSHVLAPFAIAAAHALPYALVLSLNGEVYERFLLPLLPYAACLAAWVLVFVWRELTPKISALSLRREARTLLAFIFLGGPLLIAAQFVRVSRAPDSYEQASAWLAAHAAPAAKILVTPGAVLPMECEASALALDMQDPANHTLPWFVYQSLLPAARAKPPTARVHQFPVAMALPSFGLDPERMMNYLREHEIDYLVFEGSRKMHNLPLMRSLEYAARQLGTVAWCSEGSAPGTTTQGGIDYQAVEDFAGRLLDSNAFGPPLRIYKIDRAK